MNNLGNNIKHLRVSMGLSQKKLGDLVGASQTSIAHYELGTRQPTIETLIMMSSIFRENIDTLIGNKIFGKIEGDKTIRKDNLESLLMESLLKKDDRAFIELFLNSVLPFYDVTDIMENVFREILYKIGTYWVEGSINEAEEHYATNIIRKAVNYISIMNMDIIKTKSAITFSISQDTHTIGVEMVNTLLESLGVKSVFLGSNLPYKSIKNVIEDYQPDYVFISITLRSQINNLIQLLDYLHDTLGDTIQIVIGGQGYYESNLLNNYKNVTYIQSIAELKNFIKE